MQTSLYIHIPWCIKKCPYCDFNSHKSPDALPEQDYVRALLEDLQEDISVFGARPIHSIFIGGGTPSLLQAQTYQTLFAGLQQYLQFDADIEITMEANPGTFDMERFAAYRQLGINRLSLGIQSFHDKHLKLLGRIHDGLQARHALEHAMQVGFNQINIDLMHGLPNQSVAEGLQDIQTACFYEPQHISWYQLTIESNTFFYKKPPTLPPEDVLETLEKNGLALLRENGFKRYEISAFCRPHHQAKHNLNYWRFGDYYGIGAGAHGKLTDKNGHIFRTSKQRQPHDYLNPQKPYRCQLTQSSREDMIFEFILNTSRLEDKIPLSLFSETTGLSLEAIQPYLKIACEKGFIVQDTHDWQVTALGRRFTNDLQALFLNEST